MAQWLAYGLTVIAFMRRGHLDAYLMTRSHLIHGAVALAAFVAAAVCDGYCATSALVSRRAHRSPSDLRFLVGLS